MHELSQDKITGQVAPIGFITGFAQSYVRSAWPTPIGKPITNRKIALYAKKGYYATNIEARKVEKEKKQQRVKLSNFIEDFI